MLCLATPKKTIVCHCRTKRMTHFSISGSKKQDRAGMLQRWRCCRTTSPLEGWHLHLRRLTDPTTKGKSGHLCLVRIGLRVFRWNVDAAVRLGFLPDLGHHQLWLLDDLLRAVRKMGLPVSSYPSSIRSFHAYKPVVVEEATAQSLQTTTFSPAKRRTTCLRSACTASCCSASEKASSRRRSWRGPSPLRTESWPGPWLGSTIFSDSGCSSKMMPRQGRRRQQYSWQLILPR